MKILCAWLLSIGLIFVSARGLDARVVVRWTDQQLLDKSDLVVIAVPTATHDTQERGPLPGDDRQSVIGVQTDFVVTSVLKGVQTIKTVALHHYRPDGVVVGNAPTFISFDPTAARAFRLYLVLQADGSYTPTAGQEDPDLSIREEFAK